MIYDEHSKKKDGKNTGADMDLQCIRPHAGHTRAVMSDVTMMGIRYKFDFKGDLIHVQSV